jgi:hypothetical protein
VISSPCKDCPRRHTACHDTCGDYQAYKARLDAAKAQRMLENETEGYINHRIRTIHLRAEKRRHGRG